VKQVLDKFLPDQRKGSKFPIKDEGLGCDPDARLPPINPLIGSLRFLADRTRPDLLYPVGVLSRYVVNPNHAVMRECNRLMKYILTTKDMKLVLGSRKPMELFGMSDASYVQTGDCRSVLGYAIYMGYDSAPVYCRCMRAGTVSLSSTQAEVEALVELLKEVIWFQGFMESVYIELSKPTTMLTDNMPTVTLAGEGNHLRRSRHFVVRTAFLKEQVEMGTVVIRHVPGSENPTDMLTKALSGRLLDYHTNAILGLSST
jgi:hypothetical protein